MPETRYPPDGVKCVDCGCCQAAIYAGDEPLCWSCDAGTHPDKKKDPEPASEPVKNQSTRGEKEDARTRRKTGKKKRKLTLDPYVPVDPAKIARMMDLAAIVSRRRAA